MSDKKIVTDFCFCLIIEIDGSESYSLSRRHLWNLKISRRHWRHQKELHSIAVLYSSFGMNEGLKTLTGQIANFCERPIGLTKCVLKCL